MSQATSQLSHQLIVKKVISVVQAIKTGSAKLLLDTAAPQGMDLLDCFIPSSFYFLLFFFFFLISLLSLSYASTHLQSVLTASSGGGAYQRGPCCVRGAVRTFTPPLLSTAVTPPRAACVRRGFTETRRACVSFPPSAPAMTRASYGRYTHTQTHTCWPTPR